MNAENLINEVEDFSKNKLKRKDDLRILIETSIKNDKIKTFEELSFNAKYVLGLQRALRKGSMNPEISNIEKIKEDYSNNLIKCIEQIRELVNSSPEESKNHFNDTYLGLSRQSLQNVNELLEDLEWTKIYLNQQKRKTKE